MTTRAGGARGSGSGFDARAMGWLILALTCAACEDPPTQDVITAEHAPIEVAEPPIESTPPPSASTAIPEETQEALEALGYFATAPTDNAAERGVTRHEDGAWPGLNLYGSRHRARIALVDMDGREVHRWEAPERGRSWMHAEPLPDGSLLAITTDRDLTKHAWDSSVMWRSRMRAHHDLAVSDDGRILALVRGRTELEHQGATLPILADAIAFLSPGGELDRRVELVPLLRDRVSSNRLSRVAARVGSTPVSRLTRPGGVGDVLHTNSIAFLAHDITGVAPRGSILLSFRAISRVAILDAEAREVLWVWGRGELDGQHDAKQLESGHLLIFDNGLRRGSSRVIELDAARGEIVWSYEAEGLYSMLRGGAQALPNGNVLITEADRGHALEVTRDGERVWELWNPDVRDPDGRAERAIIYRLNRFPRSFFAPLDPTTD